VVLRLLTWQSPALPLGAWIAAAAAGGGVLSAAGTALALRDAGPALRRRIRREPEQAEPWEGSAGNTWDPAWSEERSRSARPESGQTQRSWGPEATRSNDSLRENAPSQARRQAPSAGPDRSPGEPPPTLSVPYRVIRRSRQESPFPPSGSDAQGPKAQRRDGGGWSAPAAEERRAEPVAVADDWGSDTLDAW